MQTKIHGNCLFVCLSVCHRKDLCLFGTMFYRVCGTNSYYPIGTKSYRLSDVNFADSRLLRITTRFCRFLRGSQQASSQIISVCTGPEVCHNNFPFETRHNAYASGRGICVEIGIPMGTTVGLEARGLTSLRYTQLRALGTFYSLVLLCIIQLIVTVMKTIISIELSWKMVVTMWYRTVS